MSSKYFPLLPVILAVLLYANTAGYDYVLDDISVISHNRFVTNGIDGLKDIWTTSYRAGYWNDTGTLYRPFTLEWQLSPNNPGLGHSLNILFYALLCFLIYYLIKALVNDQKIALITSLFFAVCTVHTEVVANIKSRDEIMSLLFGVLSWLSVLKWHQTKRIQELIFVGFLVGLGMFTKEGLIAFVAVIPISLWFFRKAEIKDVCVSAIPLTTASLIYLFARYQVLGSLQASIKPSTVENSMVNYDFSDRLLTGIKLIGMYTQKLFIPHPLAYE